MLSLTHQVKHHHTPLQSVAVGTFKVGLLFAHKDRKRIIIKETRTRRKQKRRRPLLLLLIAISQC